METRIHSHLHGGLVPVRCPSPKAASCHPTIRPFYHWYWECPTSLLVPLSQDKASSNSAPNQTVLGLGTQFPAPYIKNKNHLFSPSPGLEAFAEQRLVLGTFFLLKSLCAQYKTVSHVTLTKHYKKEHWRLSNLPTVSWPNMTYMLWEDSVLNATSGASCTFHLSAALRDWMGALIRQGGFCLHLVTYSTRKQFGGVVLLCTSEIMLYIVLSYLLVSLNLKQTSSRSPVITAELNLCQAHNICAVPVW